MSQASFIQAVISNMDDYKILDAITKGQTPEDGLENLKVYWDAKLASGKPRMDVVYQMVMWAYNTDASASGTARERWTKPVAAVVLDSFKATPPTTGDSSHSDWRTGLKCIIGDDDVETFVELDKVGLIDRAPAIKLNNGRVIGFLRHSWTMAIEKQAVRINKYLLATTALDDFGGFPEQQDTWGRNLDMARDIASHVPDAHLQATAESFVEHAVDSRDGELDRSADYMVPAMLERCLQVPGVVTDEVVGKLIDAVLKRVASPHGSDLGRSAQVVMLGVLERTGRLNSAGAFRVAQQVLRRESNETELISPAYLASLLDQGLPMQSEPGWLRDGNVSHLLAVANARHFEVFSERLADKEGFMREFGWDYLNRNSTEPSHSDATMAGAENSQLLRLAELGFPFGPIDVPDRDGSLKKVCAYDRISGAKAADAFIVGHLAGHLNESHRFDGADPVHVATVYRSAASVEALAKKGFPVNELCQSTAADYSSDYRRKFKEYFRMTPLVIALSQKNPAMDVIHALVGAGADPAIKGPTGASTMQLAKNEEIKHLVRAAKTGNALSKAMDDPEPAQLSASTRRKPTAGLL